MVVNKKSILNYFLVGLISITMLGCANVKHRPQVFQGENLITPYSGFLSGWQVHVDNKEHYHSRMWQHPELGFKNAYVVSVTPREKTKLSHFKTIIDKPGFDSCEKFTSTVINYHAKTDYLHEFWQTACLRKDQVHAKILHLLIQGNDSLYHIQKIWQGNVNSAELEAWRTRFKQIYICDTRSQKSLCPEITK